jgi:hypothetical protein
LRGTESRPLFTDIDAYVREARLMRCNVMTIGPMNGQHWTAFPTEHGVPHPQMQPDFIPRQVGELHRWGIAAIGWLPFNVQDLRRAEDCQVAAKYPQWRMQYLDWPERPSEGRVGMCVISSPWRQMGIPPSHSGPKTDWERRSMPTAAAFRGWRRTDRRHGGHRLVRPMGPTTRRESAGATARR